MEWSDLRIFLAVARAGTLGGGARALGLTQPTMGRRIRALEQAVGQSLFQRTSDGFVLTGGGASVLAHAERMEQEAIGFERSLSGQAQQPGGALRVASLDWFGVHVLSPVFARFAKTHPQVTIELLLDARLMSLARREAELAIRLQRFDDPEIIQRKLTHVAYALYAAPGQAAPRAGDGAGTALIAMDEAHGGQADMVWLQRLLPRAQIVFRSNSRDAQARMCAAGAGLAVLPRPLGDFVPGLRRVDLGEPPPGRDVWAGYHRDLRRLVRLRWLLDATVAGLASARLVRPAARPSR